MEKGKFFWKNSHMIPVTKPFMPPRKEYERYLKDIWNREFITNDGPLVKELEYRLKNFLGVQNIVYVSNGTIALQIAIKALDLKGEIITTPFSYVATTSSIVWEGCDPVFVDIDPQTLNINPSLIEEAITEKTTAILATHVFGNPCDVESIQAIADKYGLRVVYDAAHCFGTKYKGESIFNWGDICTTSFHATKLYHTVEGGATFTKDADLYQRMRYMRNFGHDGPGEFNGIGINGKNSEFHAAMGLINVNYIDQIIERRNTQCKIYESLLNGTDISRQVIQCGTSTHNQTYYPVIFKDESIMFQAKKDLEDSNIFPRRYFYPSLNQLNYTGFSEMNASEDISKKILCLPLYHELKFHEQEKIVSIIKKALESKHLFFYRSA